MQDLIQRFLAGDRRALARAITHVENGTTEAREIIKATFSRSGKSHVIGITGPPGAGKSTLVDRVAHHFRQQGRTVGIVAVDPTSPFSGGAILGDRVRMMRIATDPGIFIRSLATRGHLGGLSVATGDVVSLLDAYGFDVVLVETVGTGQSEVEIMEIAHTTMVVMVPGLGDDVQAIKAGILEIGDLFVVNKADREGADRTATELEMMLDLAGPAAGAAGRLDPTGHHGLLQRLDPTGHHADLAPEAASAADEAAGWRPPVLKAVARDDKGIAEVCEQAVAHRNYLEQSGLMQRRQHTDARARVVSLVTARAARAVLSRAGEQGDLQRLTEAVAIRQLDPYTAADEIIDRHFR